MSTIIEVEKLKKTFRSFQLHDIAFHVSEGCITGLIGIDGSGKSTIIKCLINLIQRDSGKVEFWGENINDKNYSVNSSNRVVGCGSYVEKYFLRANIMNTQRWILCPICGNKTRVMIRDDTELMNFPLFCPKCKKEVIINVKDNHITTVREPDASTQSR